MSLRRAPDLDQRPGRPATTHPLEPSKPRQTAAELFLWHLRQHGTQLHERPRNVQRRQNRPGGGGALLSNPPHHLALDRRTWCGGHARRRRICWHYGLRGKQGGCGGEKRRRPGFRHLRRDKSKGLAYASGVPTVRRGTRGHDRAIPDGATTSQDRHRKRRQAHDGSLFRLPHNEPGLRDAPRASATRDTISKHAIEVRRKLCPGGALLGALLLLKEHAEA